MNFSREWDDVYGASKNNIEWPWSDVVSLSHSFCKYLFNQNSDVLEVGCGTGANISFLKAKQFNYHGIDGNKKVIASLQNQYPEFKNNLSVDDFTLSNFFDKDFDLILDRAAITHNDNQAISSTIDNIYAHLKEGGIFMGIDWFSKNHSDSCRGSEVDSHTRTNIETGQFNGVGFVHFADKEYLLDLFSKFDILYLSEKYIHHHLPVGGHVFSAWDIIARKN